MTDRVLLAVAIFVIIKMIFRFYAWLFPHLDRIHREHLKSMTNELAKKSLFCLGQLVLIRILEPVNRAFFRPARGYLLIGIVSLILNMVVFTAASTAVITTHFWSVSEGLRATFDSIRSEGWTIFFGGNVLVGALGVLFDLLSLAVTLALLRRASVVTTGRALIGHMSIDLLVAAVSCMWAYVILAFTIGAFYEQILPHVVRFSGGYPEDYLSRTLWETLRVNPAMWYVVIGLGVSAALPTAIYLVVLLPVVILRFIPRRLQDFLNKILYRLTTDTTPIFKNLSTFTSSVGAVVGLVA